MKKEFIQNQLITIPASVGAFNTPYDLKLDLNWSRCKGIAVVEVSGSASGLSLEFKDEFGTVFKKSDVNNWAKGFENFEKDKLFRKVDAKAKGQIISAIVSGASLGADVVLNIMYKLNDEGEENLINNIEEFPFTLSYPFTITQKAFKLGGQFKKVVGVAAIVTGVNSETVSIGLRDSSNNPLMDDVNGKMLQITSNVEYEKTFYPVEFDSLSRDMLMQLKELFTVPLVTSINVKLLVKYAN